jgi:molybdopterin synthase sulfur carrier subunit
MIKVLLFAHLQEKAGREIIEIEHLPLTVKDLKKMLETNYELGSLEHVMVAVNEEYALDQDRIHQGDVVALIPPVSGG